MLPERVYILRAQQHLELADKADYRDPQRPTLGGRLLAQNG